MLAAKAKVRIDGTNERSRRRNEILDAEKPRLTAATTERGR